MSTDPLIALVDDLLRNRRAKGLKPCPSKGGKKKRKRMPTKNRTEWGWKFADGREICDDSPSGNAEYRRRKHAMANRQNWRCGYKCGTQMVEPWGYFQSVTFEHVNGRGGGKRDDRIEIDGKPYNLAVCLRCNSEKGSKRVVKSAE